jgi:hypothetical protein
MPKEREADEALDRLFSSTGERPPAQPEPGSSREKPERLKSKSIGVNLKAYEIDELGELADGLGVSRNALIVWLIRHGVAALKEGEIAPQTKTVSVLEDPE